MPVHPAVQELLSRVEAGDSVANISLASGLSEVEEVGEQYHVPFLYTFFFFNIIIITGLLLTFACIVPLTRYDATALASLTARDGFAMIEIKGKSCNRHFLLLISPIDPNLLIIAHSTCRRLQCGRRHVEDHIRATPRQEVCREHSTAE